MMCTGDMCNFITRDGKAKKFDPLCCWREKKKRVSWPLSPQVQLSLRKNKRNLFVWLYSFEINFGEE